MTSTQRIWMTRQDYTQLHNELAALRSRRSFEAPDDFMDYDANLIAGYPARRVRIREIQDLLTNAVVGEDAVVDRVAEPGMVLTIRYDATGETETFLLGRRFGEGADVTVYSTLSPLGHAIAGARPGEQRIYSIPNETRPLLVTLLEAVPYGMYVAKSPRLESAHRDAMVTARHQRSQQHTAAGMKRAPTTACRAGAGRDHRCRMMKGIDMISTQRVWISPQAYERLQRELATLRELCTAAAAGGDTDENSIAVHQGWQARIHQIHDLLVDAVVGEDPPDDGIAEPGMVLTIRYDDTGDIETFLLAVRGAEYGDMEVYSTHSPLGAAIAGARPGERRTYSLPSGATSPSHSLRPSPMAFTRLT